MRSIHTRAAENGIRKVLLHLQVGLSLELRHSIAGVGHRYLLRGEWLVGDFIAHTHSTEAADEQEILGHCIGSNEAIHERAHKLIVDAVEVEEIHALGGTEIVHHIVPLAAHRSHRFGNLCSEIVAVGIIKLNEIDALIGEKLARSGAAHSRPRLVAALKSRSHHKAADKSTGTCDKNPLCHSVS